MECDTCAIRNLVYRYAHLLDAGDLEGVAALFSHGRIIALGQPGGEAEIVGAGQVLALYQSFTRIYEDNHTPHTLHMTTNVLVEAGEGAATASSYAVVFQALEDFPLQPIIGVRYYDKFEKAGGNWRFSERRIDTHLTGDLSRHLLRDPAPG